MNDFKSHPSIGTAWETPAARGGIFGRNLTAMKQEKSKPTTKTNAGSYRYRMLAKNGIRLMNNEAVTILNFLYLIAKTFNKPEISREYDNLKGK